MLSSVMAVEPREIAWPARDQPEADDQADPARLLTAQRSVRGPQLTSI